MPTEDKLKTINIPLSSCFDEFQNINIVATLLSVFALALHRSLRENIIKIHYFSAESINGEIIEFTFIKNMDIHCYVNYVVDFIKGEQCYLEKKELKLSRTMVTSETFQATVKFSFFTNRVKRLEQAGIAFFISKEHALCSETSIIFDRDVYSESTIQNLRRFYESITDVVSNNKKVNVAQLAWLSEDEAKQIVTGFNQTSCPVPYESIQAMLLAQVAARPNAVAVSDLTRYITYDELFESSLRVMAKLHNSYKEKKPLIGVYLDSSIEMIIATWGILFAGCGYVPLSTEYPQDRIKYMATDSGLDTIITTKQKIRELKKFIPDSISLLDIESIENDKKTFETEDIYLGKFSSNDIVYVIYTSGSTGKPKAVLVGNTSITNQMYWVSNTLGLNENKVILQKTPTSFDAAQWELLANTCGAHVVMAEKGDYKNPDKLIEILIDKNVNFLQCVPTLLSALIDSKDIQKCTSLTHVFCGGEALTKKLIENSKEVLPHVQFVNLYGPTECTINSSYYVISDLAKNNNEIVSIGQPINNIKYFILDEYYQPLPLGHIGKLYISGTGLALGYHGEPSLTNEKFIITDSSPYLTGLRLYDSGDLAYWDGESYLHFVGRLDNQVKLRGFRVELDEINSRIESHVWVKHSAVITKDDEATGSTNLLAFVELEPKESALMDQGNHGLHHLSKENKRQVKLQLANAAVRTDKLLSVPLECREPTALQQKVVYGRKTYRFYEGGKTSKSDILHLLRQTSKHTEQTHSTRLEDITYRQFSEILRYFGQFHSAERLLPKYGYASPGALYATQMYLDVSSISGLQDGIYYYNPVSHELMRLDTGCTKGPSRMMLHFIGKHDAIEPIYKNNILEVLEIEAGHMLGLFERVLPDYGLGIRFSHFDGSVKTSLNLADCDYYLGTFQIDRADACTIEDPIETYIQCGSVSVADLDEGTYLFSDNALRKISKDIIKKNDTIAINQAVYERSSFGISFVDRRPLEWTSYIYLGRKLQLLQMNDMNFGFMSSGYSSKTGNPLPASIKLSQIVGGQITSSYFVVGGKVSDEQFLCKGMKEDSIHMKGPLELLKDDLDSFLPHYMRPNRILILDSLPTTVNGKIDKNALKTIDVSIETKKFIPPKTKLEHELANLWKKALKRDVISLNDNFFECGGNSLTAVRLINQMNTTLCLSLPMQIFFEAPSIADIVFYVGYSLNTTASRLISLNSKNDGKEIVYCWPGLGGYCMNLAALANAINEKYSFYGIQAYGLNENEQPYETIVQMAEHDLRLITAMQPSGPYKLWGYSFGARVAYEVAYQLESRGERVEELLLIAPGSPKVEGSSEYSDSLIYKNKKFITILYSVFMGEIKGNGVIECLEKVESKESFMDFISNKCKNLNAEFIEKIITLVELTFEFEYTFEELKQRHIKAPVKMIKAKGDDYSFIEHNNFHSIFTDIYEADVDHYEILKPVTVEKLVSAIEFLNANNINVA